jgi:hypothetical protein
MATVSPTTQAPATNRLTIQNLLQKAIDLGEQAGKVKDTQIKFLLSCLEGGYHNAADLVPNKHGQDIDDATKLAETYVKAQASTAVFDAKAPNQRKLVSTLRTAIKLGQWSKGGVGEPIATVNNLVSHWQKTRRNPALCKKLDDAANTFLKYARAQLKRDDLIEGDELHAFCFKKDSELPTAEKVLEGIKTSLDKLAKGHAAQNTACDNSAEVKDALKAVTKRLDEIAKGRKGGKV